MLIDAHTHMRFGDETEFKLLLRKNLIISLLCASSVAQYHRFANHLRSEMNQGRVFLSFGIHPWEATNALTADQIELLHQATVIGEIGMDTVWCQTPLQLQRTVFLQQLEIAHSLNKPIILHSKGRENEIAAILKEFMHSSTGPKVAVHWYSGPEDTLERLIEMGCYFTLAPDVTSNPVQMQVARNVPLNRLLTESDGVEGVSWALGKEAEISDIPFFLESIIQKTAELRSLDKTRLKKTVYENFMRFVTYE